MPKFKHGQNVAYRLIMAQGTHLGVGALAGSFSGLRFGKKKPPSGGFFAWGPSSEGMTDRPELPIITVTKR